MTNNFWRILPLLNLFLFGFLTAHAYIAEGFMSALTVTIVSVVYADSVQKRLTN